MWNVEPERLDWSEVEVEEEDRSMEAAAEVVETMALAEMGSGWL